VFLTVFLLFNEQYYVSEERRQAEEASVSPCFLVQVASLYESLHDEQSGVAVVPSRAFLCSLALSWLLSANTICSRDSVKTFAKTGSEPRLCLGLSRHRAPCPRRRSW
jgi:hypothetical protein